MFSFDRETGSISRNIDFEPNSVSYSNIQTSLAAGDYEAISSAHGAMFRREMQNTIRTSM